MNNYIPAFHFADADSKLTKDWCWDAVQYHWYQSGLRNYNLLRGKNVKEIEEFAAGEFNTNFSKQQFPTFKIELKRQFKDHIKNMVLPDEFSFGCLALIPAMLDAAVEKIIKRGLKVRVKCTDALAYKLKKKDLEFLKTKSQVEDHMAEFYDDLSLGKPDLGATEHSSVPYNALPFGLDVDNEDEFRMFAEYIYNLGIEAAFKTILDANAAVTNTEQVVTMNAYDHFKFGVACSKTIRDYTTGLPVIKYKYPNDLYTDGWRMMDFSDSTVWMETERLTPMELYERYRSEIGSKEDLQIMINAKGEYANGKKVCGSGGYAFGNDIQDIQGGGIDQTKVTLYHFEVKTCDYIDFAEKETEYGKVTYVTKDPTESTDRRWAQNTIKYTWLANTRYFFDIDRLPFAYRQKGREAYTSFSYQACRSKKKSAVELAIPQNKIAQVAWDKKMFIVIMSRPPGAIINMAGLRKAHELAVDKEEYSMAKLANLVWERNVMIIDTEGFEGRKEAQPEWFRAIPGGLGAELGGYDNVIQMAKIEIASLTSITPQITGQNPGIEGKGLNELLERGSLAGIGYVGRALIDQYKKAYNISAGFVKEAIEEGGDVRDSIQRSIGENNVDLINRIPEMRLHEMGAEITMGVSEEQIQAFHAAAAANWQKGVLNSYEFYLVMGADEDNIQNAAIVMGVKEARFARKQEENNEKNRQALIQREQEVGKNMQAQTQMMGEMEAQKMGMQAQIDKDFAGYMSQLGLQKEGFQWRVKSALQQQRFDLQRNNKNNNLAFKNMVEQQKAIQGG